MSSEPDTLTAHPRQSSLTAYTAEHVFADGALVARKYVVVDGDTIVGIVPEAPERAAIVDFGEAAIHPSTVNTTPIPFNRFFAAASMASISVSG